jgi:ABC-type antimicrobial peptide transport system permease subunit
VPITIDAATVLVPTLVAVGLGGLFSYWPARAAARIEPSEALRND